MPDNTPIPVKIKGVMPAANGFAVFLEATEKIFVIHVEPVVANAIKMALKGEKTPRPLTHDLFCSLLDGLNANISHVLINHASQGTYYARLVVHMKNEVAQKLIEIDARPSDCLILAIKRKVPIFITRKVLEETEDMSDVLNHFRSSEDDESDEKNTDE